MSVLVKGMEMPKTEEESRLLILTPDGVTWLTQLGIGNQKFDTIEVPAWIPVTEHLPEENGRYLTVMHRTVDPQYRNELGNDDTEVRIIRYCKGEWKVPLHSPKWINEAITDIVTHWMPLPEPPKEETCTKN